MFGPKWLVSFFSLISFTNATPSISVFRNQKPWEPCPVQCGLVGSDPQNWGVYHDLDALNRCDRPLLMNFAVGTPLNQSVQNKIQACSIWGDAVAASEATSSGVQFLPENVTVTRAHYGTGVGSSRDGARALFYLRTHLEKQVPGLESNSILFIKSGNTVVGFFGGSQLDNFQVAEAVVPGIVADFFVDETSRGVLEQICGTGRNSRQTWGVVVSFDGSLLAVQDTVHTWSQGACVYPEDGVSPNFARPASLSSLNPASSARSVTIYTSSRQYKPIASARTYSLQRRASCSTTQIQHGDTCTSLATRCGVTVAKFESFNAAIDCNSPLTPGQHVCCSSGTLPDFTPKPNSDGTCATYTVKADDNCREIAAANGLTVAKLEGFNKNTWGWNGCGTLWANTRMCLSTGNPPMPAPVANAMCGPQVPGTKAPTDGTDLADLNPCPLNACCDIWGQCGTTADFCTKSVGPSGAPGTAAAEQNGCISNCGTLVVSSDAPASYQKIAYFQGDNFGRPCLNMDVTQIDTDKYTHVHFGFGTLSEDFKVMVGNDRSQFEFERFKLLRGVKRILSIGGWDFSTNPDTYMIFRNAVLPANRYEAAQNIANFVNDNGLDGVDIDWEYPGATDTGPPPAEEGEGLNYATFLFFLKGLLPDKSVSIAAPASYWYLRAFPMKTIAAFIDYVVYMTYDLHGQWDYANQWAVPGCPAGDCLRSHVNITETYNSLSMITKAGVPSNKIYVGVASYGRSFKMTTPGCTGPMCTYVGKQSDAAAGRCTHTNSYISNAEIDEIIATNPTAQTFMDNSFSNVLVYNNTEWAAYMDDENKRVRDALYSGLNFAGTVDWATDLSTFHGVPADAWDETTKPAVFVETWGGVKSLVDRGHNPFVHGDRHGNWSDGSVTCTDIAVQGALDIPADRRWTLLGCQDAYEDAVSIYREFYPTNYFTEAVSHVYHGPEQMQCGYLSRTANCDTIQKCDTSYEGEGSGPAGYEVLNSFIKIQESFEDWYSAINEASGEVIYYVENFLNHFAPVPDSSMTFNLLMDSLGLLVPTTMAPFFNSMLKSTAYFTAHPTRLDTTKDIAYTVVASLVNYAKDGKAGFDGWDKEDQLAFKTYMGTVWSAWKNATETTSLALFDGSAKSTELLGRLIKDGQLIEGSFEGNTAFKPMTRQRARTLVEQSFFSYVVPVLWKKADINVFVIDTGHACDPAGSPDNWVNPVPNYVYDKDMATAGACFQNKLYFLMYPEGASNGCQLPTGSTMCGVTYKFKIPPGLETMGKKFENRNEIAWGGLLPIDIIGSTVNSYVANGNKNGWSLNGLSSYSDDLDAITQQLKKEGIIGRQIRAAGHNTIPMCSAEEAWMNWGVNTDLKNYPCND